MIDEAEAPAKPAIDPAVYERLRQALASAGSRAAVEQLIADLRKAELVGWAEVLGGPPAAPEAMGTALGPRRLGSPYKCQENHKNCGAPLMIDGAAQKPAIDPAAFEWLRGARSRAVARSSNHRGPSAER